MATLDEGDPEASDSIATTLRYREGRYSFFPKIAHCTLDPYLKVVSAKQGGIKYYWYDSTWDWTLVSRTIGEHSTQWTNGPAILVEQQWFNLIHGWKDKGVHTFPSENGLAYNVVEVQHVSHYARGGPPYLCSTFTRLAKAWTAIDRLSIIWKSDLTDKIKRSFFSKQRSCRYYYMDAPYGR